MTPTNGARRWFRQSRGFTLIEAVVMMSVTAALVPAVVGTISAASRATDNAYDRSILFELGQSQFEDVLRQTFQTSPASYSLISMPAGYAVLVATVPAVTYTYPAPSSINTVETVQIVTVTVTGVRGDLTFTGYKAR